MTWARLCEHGEVKAHVAYGGKTFYREDCPGGSVLPDDTLVIVKEDGEWPPELVDVDGVGWWYMGSDAKDFFDALAAAQGSQE